MSFRIVLRENIADEKWTIAVNSYSETGYEHLTFLDALGIPFKGLVYGDYKFVMPLFERSKLGLVKYCFLPILLQRVSVPAALEVEVLTFLRQKYFHFHLSFNGKMEGLERQNFLLPANDFGSLTQKNRRLIERAEEEDVICAEIDTLTAKENFEKTIFCSGYLNPFEVQIVRNAMKNGDEVFRYFGAQQSGQTIAAAMVYATNNRWIYLKSGVHKAGASSNAGLVLLDYVIRNRPAETVFDFGGSSIKGIADFFKKFNPIQEYYTECNYLKWPILRTFRA